MNPLKLKRNRLTLAILHLPAIRIGNYAISGRFNLDHRLWEEGWTVRLFGWGCYLILYKKHGGERVAYRLDND